MIYTIAGDVGSGKTLKVLPWMKLAVEAGRPVYTNIQLTSLCPFLDKVALIGTDEHPVALEDDERQQIQRKLGRPVPQFFWEYVERDALVVVDEADIYFDSSDFGEMKRQTKIYHKQHRKMGHDIVYIVQRISNLYKRIRDLSGRFILAEHNYRTSRLFGMIEGVVGREYALSLSKFFYWEFGDPDFNPRSLRGVGEFTYNEASEFFGWYSTEQLLGDCQRIINGNWRDQDVHAESGDVVKATRRGGKRRDEPRGVDSPAVAAALEALGHSGGGALAGVGGL